MSDRPAVLGGEPAFDTLLPVARPVLPTVAELSDAMDATLSSGLITNAGQVRAFEAEIADYLGVAHVVAVNSCTSALMLLLRCLGLSGPVVVPSFTFMASGHAVLWSGASVTFADCGPRTWTIDPDSAAAAGGGAVLATHTFGSPCDVRRLEDLGVPVVLDAAHGFGGRYPDGSMIGTKGIAEAFSLSPTKPLSTGEGGLVTTNDEALAAELRIAREYGNPGSYNSVLVGLNGRMTETAAILGRAGLAGFPHWIERRGRLARRYLAALREVPGLSFQQIPDGAVSSYKDFTIHVTEEFGLTRTQLAECLHRDNVDTRGYFDPPLHRQTVYRDVPGAVPLPVTERLSAGLLTLPLHSQMEVDVVDRVCGAIRSIAEHATTVRDRLAA
ncbi:DegT/DnrJ/EryC1/StrS family aminotransferase [Kutzneria sp. NPDC052558]|uniref:DegT/DnrJ/EryC1/StrS family aminotransferase n=1 Tax=Kutzneria sp. NPDC052558 TaxID=3364121 RepID=UPI0037CC2C4B